MDFDPEEEKKLCRLIREKTGSEFVFVTHYPSAKRPFYAMNDPQNPEETLSFDLLFRGMECKQPLSAASRAAFPGQSRPY